jgi:hypothetical protein
MSRRFKERPGGAGGAPAGPGGQWDARAARVADSTKMKCAHAVGDRLRQVARGVSYVYRLKVIEPHTRANGAPSLLLRWVGECIACGAAFDQLSGRRPKSLLRRCKLCREARRAFKADRVTP